MRLFDKTFWTFVAHTGRIPAAPAACNIADPTLPLAMKIMSGAVYTPGDDVLDPQAVTDAVERNQISVPKPVLAMVPLQPQRLRTDAMGVPQSLIAPVHQTIATYLKGA